MEHYVKQTPLTRLIEIPGLKLPQNRQSVHLKRENPTVTVII